MQYSLGLLQFFSMQYRPHAAADAVLAETASPQTPMEADAVLAEAASIQTLREADAVLAEAASTQTPADG